MPADTPFYGPLAYSGFWLFLGLALAAAAVGWVGYAVVSTRPPRPVADASIPRFHASPGLRRVYLGRIEEIAELLEAGEIGSRTAAQELSRIVRGFLQEATGVGASRMTLEELRRQPVPAVAAAVERFYPGEFSAPGEPDAEAALGAARTVVGSWI
ncbi:hypothetical protein [Sinomonas atrocyanea]|uniref:hypothetical protein n=1 Tax=Sinomonas atrocyanea TaxID=37927 RepID=UPI002863E87C|nr:hypothetical protein [Sinomonas atrocyanea]MDR6622746.1 hypothetical protein [Sinomonas atrocyanea]